jgi:hypothetical protein
LANNQRLELDSKCCGTNIILLIRLRNIKVNTISFLIWRSTGSNDDKRFRDFDGKQQRDGSQGMNISLKGFLSGQNHGVDKLSS